MGRAGDGSTLSLDFTTMGGVLDPRLTFTRASTVATYINSSGYVATATTNEPRFDYSPTTVGSPNGLLIEAAATNYLKSSDELLVAQGYGEQDILSRTTGTSPSNGTAVGFYPTTVSGYHRVSSPYLTGLSGAFTASVWYKRLNSSLRAGINANAMLNVGAVFDLNGAGSVVTLGGSAANKAATITAYPNDWYRVTVTGTRAADGGVYFFMAGSSQTDFDGGTPFVGVAGQGMLMWGAQLELGSGASSLIPTGASQVTRAVDTAIIAAGTNFSSWYTGGTTGTFVSNWYGNASSTTARSVIATSDQITKHLHMYQTPSALTLRLADFNAAATVTTANSLTANALTRGAFSYASTATSLCLNGGTVATGTLAFTVAPTWLSIGGPSTNGTSITDTTVMLNNSIRTLKYFPTRLSDAQIQTLTTP